MSNVRVIAGWTAIGSMVPYLVLKALWVMGVGVGVHDPDLMRQPEMLAANALTGGMQLVGAGVALALIRPWGTRLPAWLVLFPLWVGTGLLAPMLVAVPVGYAANAIGADGPTEALASWVPMLVYGGFMVQAVALLTAFAAYARQRWDKVLRGHTRDVATGPTHGLQRLLAIVAAGLAAVGAVVTASDMPGGTFAEGMQKGLSALLAALAAAGLLMLVRLWWPGARFWWAVALTWLGTAGMFAQGILDLLFTLLGASAHQPSVLLLMLTATIAGLVAAFLLAERDWEARVG